MSDLIIVRSEHNKYVSIFNFTNDACRSHYEPIGMTTRMNKTPNGFNNCSVSIDLQRF